MSSYHSSFSYLGKNSATNFGWIICHFDSDNGETDSYLSQDQVYTASYDGSRRNLYGTRWNSVANVKITVIKQNGGDFTFDECREAYKWLTGNPEASWMDLYIGDEVKYRLICTIQDVKPQKLDARTIGLNIYCESLSPWAFSPPQIYPNPDKNENGTVETSMQITINNESDDIYSFVYPKVVYERGDTSNLSHLVIDNITTGETTEITNLALHEKVTLDSNQIITSNRPNKKFGNTFNFVWPRLKSGTNIFNITGRGKITFEYSWPIKMGDCCRDINLTSDPICNESGEIQVDTLPWKRISNTPTTLAGYGIDDAYTKSEVNYAVTQAIDNISALMNPNGIILTDRITKQDYVLYVSNGKLTLEQKEV